MAMAPTVVKAAWRGSTPSGTGTQRLTGTQLTSACNAYWLPAQATRWPTAKPVTPAPTSMTVPQSE